MLSNSKKIIIILIFLISLISISCEKVIPFDGEVASKKIVINSIFQSDSTFKVHVSNSKSIIDSSSFENIENAIVNIKHNNGSFVENLPHLNNGFYVGQTYPVQNQTYILEVSHPNFENVNALESLPFPITINSIDTVSLTDPINGDRYEITVNFKDPKNIPNYYLIETYVIFESLLVKNQDTLENDLDTAKQEMLLTDEVFQNNGSPWKEQGLFNDLLFDGNNKNLKVEIPNNDFLEIGDDYTWSYKTKGIRFYLHNISSSYYYYLISLQTFRQASGNPFAQPVQVFSNVNNGFGVFAGSQVNFFDL